MEMGGVAVDSVDEVDLVDEVDTWEESVRTLISSFR
jgi:hypothetical protein